MALYAFCPIGGRLGTAMLTATAPEGVKTDSNVAASCIKWEGQHIWLISAYFPNSLEGTKATIKGLRAVLNTLKTKRVILAGDFNCTETLSSFDTGGLLPPLIAKDRNAEAIQEVLNDWRFKDLWTKDEQRELQRKNLDHLTYWNHKHTRGVRIDRVYANFSVEADITVSTHHHPGSDHKGVLYSWSHRAPAGTGPLNRPLPHRAFELKEVIEYNKAILVDYWQKHLEGPHAFPKWDKAKRLMRIHAIEAWEKKVRARGSHLKSIAKRVAKLERDLHALPVGSSNRAATRVALHQYKVKTTLEQICINDEDMRPTEQYGPAFIKRNENSRLYQAQMFRTCINSIKENAWIRDYSVDLELVRKLHLNTFAHSKVKGFM
jgi:exonuclease III